MIGRGRSKKGEGGGAALRWGEERLDQRLPQSLSPPPSSNKRSFLLPLPFLPVFYSLFLMSTPSLLLSPSFSFPLPTSGLVVNMRERGKKKGVRGALSPPMPYLLINKRAKSAWPKAPHPDLLSLTSSLSTCVLSQTSFEVGKKFFSLSSRKKIVANLKVRVRSRKGGGRGLEAWIDLLLPSAERESDWRRRGSPLGGQGFNACLETVTVVHK